MSYKVGAANRNSAVAATGVARPNAHRCHAKWEQIRVSASTKGEDNALARSSSFIVRPPLASRGRQAQGLAQPVIAWRRRHAGRGTAEQRPRCDFVILPSSSLARKRLSDRPPTTDELAEGGSGAFLRARIRFLCGVRVRHIPFARMDAESVGAHAVCAARAYRVSRRYSPAESLRVCLPSSSMSCPSFS